MENVEGLFGMFIGFCLVVVVPLIAILTTHQRKMAELFRGKDQQANQHLEARLQQMQGEISQLHAMLAEHVIQLDDQRSMQGRAMPPQPPSGLSR